jgi:hypothetical protein
MKPELFAELEKPGRVVTGEKRLYHQLLEASRMAGMAAAATSVLHNAGNVLSSVNRVTSIVSDQMRQSRIASLGKAAALLREHEGDLAAFLTQNDQGKQLPGYLHNLAGQLAAEQAEVAKELASLNKNVDHIKEIVAMQQDYARICGIPGKSTVKPTLTLTYANGLGIPAGPSQPG